jgi:hypothetical protein
VTDRRGLDDGASSTGTGELVLTAVFVGSLLVINPVYVVLVFALFRRWRTDSLVWWAVPIAIALFVANRQTGVMWGFETAFGMDDATGYLEKYERIRNGGLREVLTRFEPALFLLYRLYAYCGVSDRVVFVLSTAVPLVLLSRGLRRTTERPLLFMAVLVGLIPGFWESTFHLFRNALAVSLLIPRLAEIARGREVSVRDALIPACAHVATLFFTLPLLAFSVLQGSRGHRYPVLVLAVMLSPIPLGLALASLLPEGEVVRSYLSATGELSLSRIFILFFAFAIAGVVIFRNTYLGVLCASVTGAFLLALAGVGAAAERMILLGTLCLSVPIFAFVQAHESRRRLTVALAVLYIAFGSTKYDGGEDYPKSSRAYIANGHFYSIWAGIDYNLLGVLRRLDGSRK